MNMTLGAEPKKVAILGALLVVAPVVYWMNSTPTVESGPTATPAAPAPARPTTTAPTIPLPSDAPTAANRADRAARREFRPSPRPKRGEARPDPMSVDPTLRLDVLAKLQQVNVEGMHRSIFDFGQAPPPPSPVVKAPKAPSPFIGPARPPQPEQQMAEVTPPKPQAPPIPFKFYGYITNNPNKRAFFMDGEDIHVVREGDVVKNRYKIVRIGVNSVTVEDMQFKSQQTLPLEEQPA